MAIPLIDLSNVVKWLGGTGSGTSGDPYVPALAMGYETNGFTTNPSYASTVYGGFALPGGNALKNAGYYLGGSDTTPDVGREGSVWNGRGYS